MMATPHEKYPMTAEGLREVILSAARKAERITWEVVNNRSATTGEVEEGWGTQASRAEWLARRENSLLALTDELGWRLHDDEGLEAAIAAERKRYRDELDAKWLRPRTEDDGIPE